MKVLEDSGNNMYQTMMEKVVEGEREREGEINDLSCLSELP